MTKSALAEPLRALERRLYAGLLHPRAALSERSAAGSWDPAGLAGHQFCLLVSFRRDGTPVPTPVWFACDGARIVIRSGATDGKVKRIRGTPEVLIAPCSFRGRQLGPAMRGRASILDPAGEPSAEAALRSALGVRRRAYQLVRDPLLEAAYIAVTG